MSDSREHPVISFSDFEILQFISMLKRSRPPWIYDALCAGEPTEFFFPGQGQASYQERGLDICRRCPVRKDCFTYAMENPELEGTWGGATNKQRNKWVAAEMDIEEAWSELLDSETTTS
jgi:hypothetical protein